MSTQLSEREPEIVFAHTSLNEKHTSSSTLVARRQRCSALEIRAQRLISNFTWKAVFVEPSRTCYVQNLLLVLFVTRACGNIAHGPLVFIVNRKISDTVSQMLQIKLTLVSFTFPETKRNIQSFSLLQFQCFKFHVFFL